MCLCALLQNGVVHRDLKLENILLDQDLNVKVSLLKNTHPEPSYHFLKKKHNHACFGKINEKFPSKNSPLMKGLLVSEIHHGVWIINRLKSPDCTFVFEHKGIYLYDTGCYILGSSIFSRELVQLVMDLSSSKIKCTFRTYIGAHSAHCNFNVLLSHAHWTSTNILPDLIKEPRGHFLPYLGTSLLIWELRTAKGNAGNPVAIAPIGGF